MDILQAAQQNPIVALIVACEVGLWVLLLGGLALRYLLRLRRVSAAVLAGIPLLDVVLVVAVALDLMRGAEVEWVHGLAAYYLGVSLAFGPAMVRYVDVRFAHRFAAGPPPPAKPRPGAEKRAAAWKEWYRVVTAAAIASLVLLGLIVFFAKPEAQQTLLWWIGRAWAIAGLWLLFGPLFESGKSAEQRSPGAEARSNGG
ncbi:hypothetical protein [Psychromicrobium lacuslunae]|uniref:Membrane protein n=1 Tax=Psychromicrobium lacuslunae TaxID=1618207 RepID=A0A0D4BW68_9MICC|nr:hypothetical protein [Psychromicrobium lacuslunae]AJT40371.1 membrane protein [Psychromicrobium lacuslunae]